MKKLLFILGTCSLMGALSWAASQRMIGTQTMATATNGVWRLLPSTNAVLHPALQRPVAVPRTAPMSVMVSLVANGTATTPVTFRFRPMVGGLIATRNEAGNFLDISVPVSGTTPVVFFTNVAASVVAGPEQWVLWHGSNANSATIFVSNIVVRTD